MLRISAAVIPHYAQRYPTVGDWLFNKAGSTDMNVFVSDMKNDDYAFLVMIHEMIEAYLCLKRGISEESVSAFDIQFEKETQMGIIFPNPEPGDHVNAPYKKEHFFATTVERLIAAELNVDWEKYDEAIQEL